MSDLPDLLPLASAAEVAAAEWGVELGEPYSLGRYSYVAPAGDDAVLKVRPASDEESEHEAEALALWDGDGAVRLLRSDPARRTILIERARPGSNLAAVGDDEAVAAAVDVGRRLWRPAGAPFRPVEPHVRRWLDQAEADGRDARTRLVPEARRVLDALAPRCETLTHGDFQHQNLLRHGDRILAIDPKPYLAEPEFDVPTFLWNPLLPDGSRVSGLPLERTRRRIELFRAVGLDGERIRAWTLVRAAYLGADEGDAEAIRSLL